MPAMNGREFAKHLYGQVVSQFMTSAEDFAQSVKATIGIEEIIRLYIGAAVYLATRTMSEKRAIRLARAVLSELEKTR